jgi:hypothetical protein
MLKFTILTLGEFIAPNGGHWFAGACAATSDYLGGYQSERIIQNEQFDKVACTYLVKLSGNNSFATIYFAHQQCVFNIYLESQEFRNFCRLADKHSANNQFVLSCALLKFQSEDCKDVKIRDFSNELYLECNEFHFSLCKANELD